MDTLPGSWMTFAWFRLPFISRCPNFPLFVFSSKDKCSRAWIFFFKLIVCSVTAYNMIIPCYVLSTSEELCLYTTYLILLYSIYLTHGSWPHQNGIFNICSHFKSHYILYYPVVILIAVRSFCPLVMCENTPIKQAYVIFSIMFSFQIQTCWFFIKTINFSAIFVKTAVIFKNKWTVFTSDSVNNGYY